MTKNVARATHTIDATGKAPGRLATQVSRILIGKHKADFTPHIDGGDFVEVTNVSKMSFSGKKLDTATFKRHSGFQGGLKEKRVKAVFQESPEEVLRHAVSKMLPKNSHRTERMKRLTFKK
jgi:large subunit ribosomal protein L13